MDVADVARRILRNLGGVTRIAEARRVVGS
jgi:hypothetical protein